MLASATCADTLRIRMIFPSELEHAALQGAMQAAYVAGLVLVCCIALHQLSKLVSSVLVDTFGWRGTLATAWLGTPIHELSHALMCVVFRHRIVELQLFRPEPGTGSLGYVSHTFDRSSTWQRAGMAFIGIAPLFAGATAMVAAFHLLLPDIAAATAGPALPAQGAVGLDLARHASSTLWAYIRQFAEVLCTQQLTRIELWVFLYICMCVGSHLSPSPGDLRGAIPGLLLLLAGVVALAAAGQMLTPVVTASVMQVGVRGATMLLLAIVLNAAVLVALTLAASLYWGLRHGHWGAALRGLSHEWKRLGVLGTVVAGALAVSLW